MACASYTAIQKSDFQVTMARHVDNIHVHLYFKIQRELCLKN